MAETLTQIELDNLHDWARLKHRKLTTESGVAPETVLTHYGQVGRLLSEFQQQRAQITELHDQAQRDRARVEELEAGIKATAKAICSLCDQGKELFRDEEGRWRHASVIRGTRVTNGECFAAHLWDILNPKTDPTPTDRPIEGESGEKTGDVLV